MIRELPWSEDVTAKLTHLASRECLPLLANEVRAGVSQLFECTDGVDTLHVVTRLDRTPDELVICYVQGSGVRKFIPQFIERARQLGVPVRMHTTDERVLHLCQRVLGFGHDVEFVARVRHGSKH